MQRSEKCLKTADVKVRGRQFLALGIRSVEKHVAKAEASVNMECNRSLKYGGAGTKNLLARGFLQQLATVLGSADC